MTTIPSNKLETVSGGRLLIREPERDTKAAIEGGKVIGQRDNNFSCNGGICGGQRVHLFFF